MNKVNKLKKLNKKAAAEKSMNTLVSIIIAVAVLGLMLLIFPAVLKGGTQETKDLVCRTSVETRGNAKISLLFGTIKEDNLAPLLCEAKPLLEIKGTRTQIKKTISEEAARCWAMYAEGRYDDTFNAKEGEKKCAVCRPFKIQKKMDDGKDYVAQAITDENPNRDQNIITKAELSNYLAGNQYNPSIFFAGGTKKYMSGQITLEKKIYELENPDIIALKRIESTPLLSYVQDYSNRLTTDQIDSIDEAAKDLSMQSYGNTLVIIADRFDDLKKSDAIKLIENPKIALNTDEDSKDAILLIVELSNDDEYPEITVIMGIDLQMRILEHEIQEILDDASKNVQPTQNDFTKTIVKIMNAINLKVNLGENAALWKEHGIDSASYMGYISNIGTTPPVISDIESGKEYQIAYASPTNEQGFFEGIWGDLPNSDTTNWFNMLTSAAEATRPNKLIIGPTNIISRYCEVTN